LALAVTLFIMPAAAHATPTFLSPIDLSAAGQDAFEPQVEVAADGTVIAVWTRSDGTNFRIQSSNRTPSGAWQTAQTVSDPGFAASGPALALDPSGNAIVAWVQGDGANLRIHASYRPAGGSFGTPVAVSASGGDASSVSASMDNSGNALLAWQRFDGTKLRVQAAIRSPGTGGAFGAVSTLSAAGVSGEEPKVAAGPNVDNNGVVVWTRNDGVSLRVQTSRRRDVVGYARPKGATPMRASLVPAFNQCNPASANRVHGAPLAYASCTPPQQSSSVLTIGSPDANGTGANFTGSVRFIAVPGNAATDADEADAKYIVNLTDVRNKTTLTDYVGRVAAQTSLQITDTGNAAETPEPGTVTTISYMFPVDCVATGVTTIGSNCDVTTTADSLVPGTVVENRRSIWQLGGVTIRDAGPNGTGYANCPAVSCGDGDESTFLTEGIFVP
jgi:hypothetical protein